MSEKLKQHKITSDRRRDLDKILSSDFVLGEGFWDDFDNIAQDNLRVTLNSMLKAGVNADLAGSWIYSIVAAAKPDW